MPETRVETDRRNRRQGGRDRRQSEQQQVELVDRLAAKPVGELALTERADAKPDQGREADPADLVGRGEAALDNVGYQGAENREIDHVEEIAGRNQG
jgi:hypothetical protein